MARIGHWYDEDGASRFRVFAPERSRVALVLEGGTAPLPMTIDPLGYWHLTHPRLVPGTRYRFEVDGLLRPDPASRRQPDGVHGASMIVDPRPARTPGWRGVPIADAILYELHLGTFTAEGTLAAAAARLPYLAGLGVTVVELLPIAAFPGHRGWGYDGTYPYALQADYGDHEDLRRFIEAAHGHGIAVLLDVVYNHFGPEGNYTAAFAPYTRPAATPWGAAINLDGEYNHGIREFFLENARYWLADIGFDGLRMDAVALMLDIMPVHLLREFTDLARAIGRDEDRAILMIAEHLRNNKYVTSATGYHFDAQWSDDLNHALFAHVTGEVGRHYANFGSFEDVVTALAKGFVLDGTRFDRHRRYLLGTDGSDTRATEHVVHIQNHDQVGNRPRGDRMIATYGRDKALLGITAVMASPFVPMLFMGEEYGETAPFLFFEDFGDASLVDSVRAGRRAEYRFADEPSPDPHDAQTFVASKLDRARGDTAQGREILAYYRALIALKRSGELGPRDRLAVAVSGDPQTGIVRLETRATLTLLNFSDVARTVAIGIGHAALLDSSRPGESAAQCANAPAVADTVVVAAHGARVLRRPETEPSPGAGAASPR